MDDRLKHLIAKYGNMRVKDLRAELWRYLPGYNRTRIADTFTDGQLIAMMVEIEYCGLDELRTD